ncbi:MAG: bifunctional hydroxymethylpyrimidine kinase/phosphomethylpyrimidine kinase [Armatimonadota bacterium]
MKVALTIAGSDTCGGAGLQADLRVFHSLGVYGASVAVALTAQNTAGVRRVHHVPPRFIGEQIDAVATDLPIAAAKTGMLGRARVVEVVAARVRRRRLPNLVVDPVLAAKDGTPLLCSRGLEALRRQLLPQARVVTPNAVEAAILSGIEIHDRESLRRAAAAISAFGVEAVVIKGGHLPGDPVDTLYWRGELREYPGERLGVGEGPVHGTGCLYSAALTAHLALGAELPEACAAAKELVTAAIREAVRLGKGPNRLAPLARAT